MKTCYAVILLWISVVLLSNVAVAGNIINNLSDDTLRQNPRIINQRLERIGEKLSGKLENRFRISYPGTLPLEYRICNHKLLLWIDTKAQSEPDINNHYYAAASKATVFGSLTNAKGLWYDDKGKPITEEEIRAYMISDYKPGCCLLGGLVGTGASFLLGCATALSVYEKIGNDKAAAAFFAIWGVGTVASAKLGYEAGEEIDRRKAINLIKEERRTGRKLPQPKRKFLPGVVIGIGAVSAAILIIGIAGD